MKHLLIIRHAKSSWNYLDMEDIDRPLNERGNHDAPMMAQRLLDNKISIDALISSPANRAISTATYFAKAFGEKPKTIMQVKDLYEAPVDVFYHVVAGIDNSIKSAAIFSHNPGITDFANSLTQTRIDNLPTCGIFAVKADIKKWSDFSLQIKEFWFFDYPKAV